MVRLSLPIRTIHLQADGGPVQAELDEAIAEILKWKNVTAQEALLWVNRLLIEEARRRIAEGDASGYSATVLGVPLRISVLRPSTDNGDGLLDG